MAIINSYPTVSPEVSDLVLLTDVSTTPNSTKTATVGDIAAFGPSSVAGATAYIAQWTQTSTNAPVPVEIYNNTGITFTWARTDVGRYTVTASSPVFTANKTFYNIQGAGGASPSQIIQPTSLTTTVASYRQISVTSGAYSDGNSGWVELRIYP